MTTPLPATALKASNSSSRHPRGAAHGGGGGHPAAGTPDPQSTAHTTRRCSVPEELRTALARLTTLLSDLIADKRERPADDLLTASPGLPMMAISCPETSCLDPLTCSSWRDTRRR